MFNRSPSKWSHRASSVKKRKSRALFLESLEARSLMAGDVLAGFRLETTDVDTGKPITSVAVGKDYILNVYTKDLRANPQGVFSGFLDVTYDKRLSDINTVTCLALPPVCPDPASLGVLYGEEYPSSRADQSQVLANEGELNDAGAVGKVMAVGGGDHLLYSVRMHASKEGVQEFKSNSADLLPSHVVLLYGMNSPLRTSQIDYGSTSITIGPGGDGGNGGGDQQDSWTNPNNSLDVNDDGFVTPHDELLIINFLDKNGGQSLPHADAPANVAPFLDVNGDKMVTPMDALLVHNAINDPPPPPPVSADAPVEFRLEVKNSLGQVVTTADVGDELTLNVYTKDLRTDAQGVWAGYLDVTYDKTLSSITGGLTYGDKYPNAHTGDTTTAGVIDEAGAFDGYVPLGKSEYLLWSVPFKATAAGKQIFSSNPADLSPAHDVLVHGLNSAIDTNKISYGKVELTIEGGVDGGGTQQDSWTNPNNSLDVDNDGFLSAVDELIISNFLNTNGGQPLPHPATVANVAPFLDVNGDKIVSAVDALLVHNALNVPPVALLAGFRLETADIDTGKAISSIAVGKDYWLNVYTKDLRDNPQGVFAGYVDVRFDENLSYVNGTACIAIFPSTCPSTIQYGDEYAVARTGDTAALGTEGLIDEVGASRVKTDALGGGEHLLFRVKMRAAKEGVEHFTSDPADISPGHAVLLYGSNQIVDPEKIDYGTASITIGPGDDGGASSGDKQVRFKLKATGLDGKSIDKIEVGQEFYVSLLAADLRSNPKGVYAAFVDMSFDASRISTNGTHTFGSSYPNAQNFIVHAASASGDLIDEAGAVGGPDILGGGEFQVWRVKMKATKAGEVTFRTNAADLHPNHNVLVYGSDSPVANDRIDFGSLTLDVTGTVDNAPVAVKDHYQLTKNSTLVANAAQGVLANDTDADGDKLTAQVHVGPKHASTFELHADGSFKYKPAKDYIGVDSFTYRAVVGGNKLASEPITVTLVVQGPEDKVHVVSGKDGRPQIRREDRSELSPERKIPVFSADASDDEMVGKSVVAVAASAKGGSVRFDSQSRSVHYDPAPGFMGEDQVTYRIKDGDDVLLDKTITIIVNSPGWNIDDPLDVDGDRIIAPIDALYGINLINREGSKAIDLYTFSKFRFYDTDNDGSIAPIDILQIINRLNRVQLGKASGEGEATTDATVSSAAAFTEPVTATEPSITFGLPLSGGRVISPSQMVSNTTGFTKQATTAARSQAFSNVAALVPNSKQSESEREAAKVRSLTTNFELEEALDLLVR